MPLLSSQRKTAVFNSRSNIDRGIILWLVALTAIFSSIQKAAANPQKTASDGLERSDTLEKQDRTYTFGDKGEERWYVQGALATTLDRVESDPRRFGLAGAGLSKFFINGHSVNLELNTIYFDQPGNNAVGINLALLGRWHIVRQRNWSFFIGGGAGVMNTTSDVPEEGASFNFTPQAGVGTTFALKNNRRLLVGLNWHHISHADLFGANPGRDSIMGYIGIDFPR